MTQYHTLNLKLFNSQLKVTLKISPNVAGDFNDEINFIKLLSTNTVNKIFKASYSFWK